MIDAVQRLGIDYYFQEEIGAILQKQFMMFNHNRDCNYCLHEVVLRFRLLRQEGYFASAGEYEFVLGLVNYILVFLIFIFNFQNKVHNKSIFNKLKN